MQRLEERHFPPWSLIYNCLEIIQPPYKIKAVWFIPIHCCKCQMAVFLFRKILQKLFYPCFIMMPAYRAFRKFKHTVYAIIFFVFCISCEIMFICIQQEIIHIQSPLQFQYPQPTSRIILSLFTYFVNSPAWKGVVNSFFSDTLFQYFSCFIFIWPPFLELYKNLW